MKKIKKIVNKLKNKLKTRKHYQNIVEKLLSQKALYVRDKQFLKSHFDLSLPERKEAVAEYEKFKKSLPEVIKSDYINDNEFANVFPVYFCLEGKIKDYVNFDALFEEYSRYGKELPEGLKLKVHEYCETEICDFDTIRAPHLIRFPYDDAQQIVVSILLGKSVAETCNWLSEDLDYF